MLRRNVTKSFLCRRSLAVLGPSRPCDESCIGSEWSCHPHGGTALSAVVLLPPAAPASVATGWLPSVDVIVPYKTKLQRSGFYLVLFDDKFLPHSTASAAGTCWGPICSGFCLCGWWSRTHYHPAFPYTLLFFLLIWRLCDAICLNVQSGFEMKTEEERIAQMLSFVRWGNILTEVGLNKKKKIKKQHHLNNGEKRLVILHAPFRQNVQSANIITLLDLWFT